MAEQCYDVGLLSESHHKINLTAGDDLLLDEGAVPLLWTTSYATSPSGQIPDQPLRLGKVSALLEAFLHPSYTTTTNDQSSVILSMFLHMTKHF